MTGNDLVEKIATDAGLTKISAKSIVDAVFDTIADAASKGSDVSISGFGKFKVKATAARMGRNPSTGAAIKIAASRKVGFTPAKALKEKVAG